MQITMVMWKWPPWKNRINKEGAGKLMKKGKGKREKNKSKTVQYALKSHIFAL